MTSREGATPNRSADSRKGAVVPAARMKIPATIDNNVPILIQECRLNEKEKLLSRRKSSNLLMHATDPVNEGSPNVARLTPNRLVPVKGRAHLDASKT